MSEEVAFNEEQCSKCASLSIQLKESKQAFENAKLEFLEAFVEALGDDTSYKRIKAALLQVRMHVLKQEAERGVADSIEAWEFLAKTWPKLAPEERNDDHIIVDKKMRQRRDRLIPIKIDQIQKYIESLRAPPLIADAFSDDEEVVEADKEKLEDDSATNGDCDDRATNDDCNLPPLESLKTKSSSKAIASRLEVAKDKVKKAAAPPPDEDIEQSMSYLYFAVMGPTFYQFKFGISTADPYHLTRPYERCNADVNLFWRVLFPYLNREEGKECAEGLESSLKRMAREEKITLKALPDKIEKKEKQILEERHDMELVAQQEEKKGGKKKKKNTTLCSGKNGGGFEVLQVGKNYSNVRWLVNKVIGKHFLRQELIVCSTKYIFLYTQVICGSMTINDMNLKMEDKAWMKKYN